MLVLVLVVVVVAGMCPGQDHAGYIRHNPPPPGYPTTEDGGCYHLYLHKQSADSRASLTLSTLHCKGDSVVKDK